MADGDNERQVRESIEHLADRVATKTAENILQRFGIDTTDPIKAQEQFQALRKLSVMMSDEDFLADMAFMRRLRVASDSVKDVGIRTVAKIIFTAAVGILLIGTKDWWLTHISLKP